MKTQKEIRIARCRWVDTHIWSNSHEFIFKCDWSYYLEFVYIGACFAWDEI